MILYLDSSRGISAGLVLGALLDAGVDATLVQRILGTITLPRIVMMRARESVGTVHGTAASVAIGPVRRETLLIDAIRALESGNAPLAVRTWGGGMLRRLLEAEAMSRGVPLDVVPLSDPVTVAELLAVSAALAALRVIRVYAALLGSDAQRTMSNEEAVESPSPALVTALLLEDAGWPAAPDAIVTPGGAAILAALAEPELPPMRLSAIGYGIAADEPRVLRCWLGELYTATTETMPTAIRTGAQEHAHPHDDGDSH